MSTPDKPAAPTLRDAQGRFLDSGNLNGRPMKERNVPRPKLLSEYDERLLEAVGQLVAQPDGTSRSVLEFLINKAVVGAAKGRTTKDDGSGRAGSRDGIDTRLLPFFLKEVRRAAQHAADNKTEMALFYLERKRNGEEELEKCRRERLRPPDLLPHPAHIIISDDFEVTIIGPMTREDRWNWELLKFYIKQTAYAEAVVRAELRTKPRSVYLKEELEGRCSFRRFLMRRVPDGWNWRESIWTPDSSWQAISRNIDRLTGTTTDKEITARAAEIINDRIAKNWGFNGLVPPKPRSKRKSQK